MQSTATSTRSRPPRHKRHETVPPSYEPRSFIDKQLSDWHTQRLCVAEFSDGEGGIVHNIGCHQNGGTNSLTVGFDLCQQGEKLMWLSLELHALPRLDQYHEQSTVHLYLAFELENIESIVVQRKFARPPYYRAMPLREPESMHLSPSRLDVVLKKVGEFVQPSYRVKVLSPADLVATQEFMALSKARKFSLFLTDGRGLSTRLSRFGVSSSPGIHDSQQQVGDTISDALGREPSTQLPYFGRSLFCDTADFPESHRSSTMNVWDNFELASSSEWHDWQLQNRALPTKQLGAPEHSVAKESLLNEADARRAANAAQNAKRKADGRFAQLPTHIDPVPEDGPTPEEIAAKLRDCRLEKEKENDENRRFRQGLYFKRLARVGKETTRQQELGTRGLFPSYGPTTGSEVLAGFLSSPNYMPAEVALKYNRPGYSSVSDLMPYLRSSDGPYDPAALPFSEPVMWHPKGQHPRKQGMDAHQRHDEVSFSEPAMWEIKGQHLHELEMKNQHDPKVNGNRPQDTVSVLEPVMEEVECHRRQDATSFPKPVMEELKGLGSAGSISASQISVVEGAGGAGARLVESVGPSSRILECGAFSSSTSSSSSSGSSSSSSSTRLTSWSGTSSRSDGTIGRPPGIHSLRGETTGRDGGNGKTSLRRLGADTNDKTLFLSPSRLFETWTATEHTNGR